MRGLKEIACISLSASVGGITDSTACFAGLAHVGGIKVIPVVAEEANVLTVWVTSLTIGDNRTVEALATAQVVVEAAGCATLSVVACLVQHAG